MTEATNNNSTPQNNPKPENNKMRHWKWRRYLPLAFLIVIGCHALLIWTQIGPTLKDPVAVPEKSTSVKLGGRELANEKISDEEFRRLARNTDRDQLERLKAKNLARKSFQQSDHASRYLRERIDEMEHQLRTSFSQSDMKDKSSVGYALKKEIERIRQDMPQ